MREGDAVVIETSTNVWDIYDMVAPLVTRTAVAHAGAVRQIAEAWPGALLAQYRLRHKSSKPSFLIIFWATVLLNCGALGLLLTPTGGRALRTALGAS